MSEDKPLITPFLFIPQSWVDNGSRPQSGIGWIACPSIFLLDTKAPKLVWAPEIGNSYRAVVLIANSGAAPVEGGFARFLLRWLAPIIQIGDPELHYEKRPIDPRSELANYFMDLGEKWVRHCKFSRRTRSGMGHKSANWDTAKDFAWQGSTLIASVFDPIQDRESGDFRSWDDRKVGMMVPNPNFAGTWVGEEFRMGDLQKLGNVRVEIKQDWTIRDLGAKGASIPTASLRILEFPNIAGRLIDYPTVQQTMVIGGSGF